MSTNERVSTSSLAIAGYFAAACLLLHLLTNNQYGYFRDELYILDCGEHLDWGYVDHAPLIAFIAKFARTVFGESLRGIRFLPALAGAGLVLLTGLIVRELGGRRFAVALACLCTLGAGIYLSVHTILTMNAFEPLFWMGCAYVAIRAVNRDEPRLWPWFGVLAGLGLMNKHSMLFFGFALTAGLLLTPARRAFRTKWMWIAAGLALLIFLPNLIWQYQHNWATLEDLQTVKRVHKNVELSPLQFMGQQIFIMGPPSVLVWVAGLWWLMRSRFRFLAWAYLITLTTLIVLKGKHYYLAPAYPMLFAAGAVFWEQRRAWARTAVLCLVALGGILGAPMALPMLAPERLLSYQRALGIETPKTEVHHAGRLPQLFGDMFGWPEMVEKIAQVYWKLPPADRTKAGIFCNNYGEAGAIDLFGSRYGLPKAVSAHQTYYFWGPRNYTGEIMIVTQSSRADAQRWCNTVEEGPEVYHPWAMAEEHWTVLTCRGLKIPLREAWPRLKHWN